MSAVIALAASRREGLLSVLASDALATDPPVSEAQRRAMFAAAEGRSTLGIPRSVGREFVGKDAAKQASGVAHVSPDGRVLLLRRSPKEENFAGHWSFPGGGVDAGETPEEGARRECREEIGREPVTLKLADRRGTPTGMTFSTYVSPVDEPFEPKLNPEHTEAGWFHPGDLPQPVHPAVARFLGEDLGAAQDMSPEEWTQLRENFAKWTREEEAEAEHQGAYDEALAIDRGTSRRVDQDGTLHVDDNPISKANICEYFGREIPKWRELGLEPERRYRLLRDPQELAKAAPTFNNLRILSKHVEPLNSVDRHPDLVIGTTGTDARFEAPYLRNTLAFWAKPAVDDIDKNEKTELSSGYYYRADMTPGSYQGQTYDGVMRDIVGNHVALVPRGRAGADVAVADSALPQLNEVFDMSKIVLTRFGAVAAGVVMANLQPMLAKDAKVDVVPLFKGVTSKNYGQKMAGIATGLKTLTDGKLAKDADLKRLAPALDALEDMQVEEGADTDPNSGAVMSEEEMRKKTEGKDASPVHERIIKLLEGKVSPEVLAEVRRLTEEEPAKDNLTENLTGTGDPDPNDERGGAKDDPPDFKGMPKVGGEPMVTQKAMDAAIAAATNAEKARAQGVREAEAFVRPWVGQLAMAHDTAEGVLRTACGALGVGDLVKDVKDPAALRVVIAAQPKPGVKTSGQNPSTAMDADTADTYSKMFPHASRIGAAV